MQALSRLNRAAPKWGKKTEDLFILDFFNPVEEIKASFDPFYTATSLSGATDINVLHELKDALDDTGVYEWFEVEEFVARYFNNEDAQLLSAIIDVAADRFNHELELSNEEKADIKIKAKQFVKIYGQWPPSCLRHADLGEAVLVPQVPDPQTQGARSGCRPA